MQEKQDQGAVSIDGNSLTPEQLVLVARRFVPVEVDPEAMLRVRRCRAVVERLLDDDATVVYGLNTGFGALRNILIERDKVEELQRNLIRSHCCGVGPPTPVDVVRAMMLLRANTLVKGHSGVRPIVVETLVEMLNRRVHPVVPIKGSVGASGDLAPLSHLVLVMIGEGEALTPSGDRVAGKDAMRDAGIQPVVLKAKEGLALNNGTQFMTAWGVLSLVDAQYLASVACQACALTIEAIKGVSDAFVKQVHDVRPHWGQRQVAKAIYGQICGSDILTVPINTARLHNARAFLTEVAAYLNQLEKDARNVRNHHDSSVTGATDIHNLIDASIQLRETIFRHSDTCSNEIIRRARSRSAVDRADAAAEEERRYAEEQFRPLLAELQTIYAEFYRIKSALKGHGRSELLENAGKLIDQAMHELEQAVPKFLPVQDDYSLRCAPQVIGAALDTFAHVRRVLKIEMNSATDNPLIFPPEPKPGEHQDPDLYGKNLELADCERAVISGGNFHGEPVAIALDQACIALAEIGSIAERRIFQLTSVHLNNGLPPFLTRGADAAGGNGVGQQPEVFSQRGVGLHSGLMIAQYTAAALVSENKTLSHPASVDSIPTCADAEDHVSMGAFAARKFADVLANVTYVVAIELLCAAQGVDFRKPAKPSRPNQDLLSAIRHVSPRLDGDRPLGKDIECVSTAIRNRDFENILASLGQEA